MTSTELQYKYKIAELLAAYSVKEQRALRKEIRETLGLTFVTFSRKLYTLENETNDFSGTDLMKIANILNCTIDSLYTAKR